LADVIGHPPLSCVAVASSAEISRLKRRGSWDRWRSLPASGVDPLVFLFLEHSLFFYFGSEVSRFRRWIFGFLRRPLLHMFSLP